MPNKRLKDHAPKSLLRVFRRVRASFNAARVQRLPLLAEETFASILRNELGLTTGALVFVHSSVDRLNLSFPFYRLLGLLRDAIGDTGTLVFPTYPELPSYAFLQSGQVFDIRKTPSYTGVLTEFARRQRNAIRSLHPTKSVCALGPLAEELTNSHHRSPYPYDDASPYYKLVPHGGILIGLGVGTRNLSFVHCVDDALKERFPVFPYLRNMFDAKCIDIKGDSTIVRTYAHDPRKMNHHIVQYMRRYVPHAICEDLTISGAPFFRASSAPLMTQMMHLAQEGITIYPKRSYR